VAGQPDEALRCKRCGGGWYRDEYRDVICLNCGRYRDKVEPLKKLHGDGEHRVKRWKEGRRND
jgi:hypothetical protein